MKNTAWVIDPNKDQNYSVVIANHRPKNAVAQVPADIPKQDYPYVKAQEQLIDGEMRWVAYVDGGEKTTAEAAASKQAQKDAAHANMIKDVYDNLYTVFRTRKPETATAEYETWKHMKDNAALYAGKGLKVDHQVNAADGTELFSPGSSLDTAQKIQDFATRKIEQAHEYGVYRAERKQQFKNELEAIEGA